MSADDHSYRVLCKKHNGREVEFAAYSTRDEAERVCALFRKFGGEARITCDVEPKLPLDERGVT